MTSSHLIVFMLASAALVNAQEREVPKDSARISISGCARGRSFTVRARPDEPIRSEIVPGRRFRLSGPKGILNEIKRQEANMVEVTGLIRVGDIKGPGGLSAGGGRVRVGGGPPVQATGDPARNIAYNEAILDIESWRPLPESCKER